MPEGQEKPKKLRKEEAERFVKAAAEKGLKKEAITEKGAPALLEQFGKPGKEEISVGADVREVLLKIFEKEILTEKLNAEDKKKIQNFCDLYTVKDNLIARNKKIIAAIKSKVGILKEQIKATEEVEAYFAKQPREKTGEEKEKVEEMKKKRQKIAVKIGELESYTAALKEANAANETGQEGLARRMKRIIEKYKLD